MFDRCLTHLASILELPTPQNWRIVPHFCCFFVFWVTFQIRPHMFNLFANMAPTWSPNSSKISPQVNQNRSKNQSKNQCKNCSAFCSSLGWFGCFFFPFGSKGTFLVLLGARFWIVLVPLGPKVDPRPPLGGPCCTNLGAKTLQNSPNLGKVRTKLIPNCNASGLVKELSPIRKNIKNIKWFWPVGNFKM